jgi:hypothetical protein
MLCTHVVLCHMPATCRIHVYMYTMHPNSDSIETGLHLLQGTGGWGGRGGVGVHIPQESGHKNAVSPLCMEKL